MLRSSVRPVRHALLAALGLGALACAPKNATSADDDSSAATGATGPSTGAAPTTTGAPAECTDPVVAIDQLYADPPVPSGFERCGDGLAHRVEAVACAVPAAPTSCTDNTGGGACTSNTDCTDQPHGSCRQDIIFGGLLVGGTCSCSYGCATDSDCPDGQLCRCAGDGLGPTAACVAADCTVDADCGDQLCAGNIGSCSDNISATHCTTTADTCDSDLDCGGVGCVWNATSMPPAWACDDSVCGRPYLVEAVAVLAPAAPRDDWHTPLSPDLDLPPTTRQRLADAWTTLARMEHASAAAFAAFTLQLLAVGAPQGLLLAAQQALADELEHARLGFGLATAYAGQPLGPGPLPLAPAAATDRPALLVALIREACVCETLSALEAREAALHAHDPVVQRVWSRIAADEQRHSELGWRTVQWLLLADPELQGLARRSFTAALAEARRGAQQDTHHPADLELRRHGLLDPSLRAALRLRGLHELIAPCAEALRLAA